MPDTGAEGEQDKTNLSLPVILDLIRNLRVVPVIADLTRNPEGRPVRAGVIPALRQYDGHLVDSCLRGNDSERRMA